MQKFTVKLYEFWTFHEIISKVYGGEDLSKMWLICLAVTR